LDNQSVFHTERVEPPLLTIVTVVFNGENGLEKTINSVLCKKSSKVEYVVLDGCSTDGSLGIIKDYRSEIDIFVSEPDSGIYDAMNKAVLLATGRWIYFLNCGDEIVADMASVLELLSRVDCSLQFFEFNIEGVERDFKFTNNIFSMPSSHQAMICKTALLKSNLFDLRYHVAADYDFFTKCVKRGIAFECNENISLAVVQSGGYSAIHEKKMHREYSLILLRNVGIIKAFIYFFTINRNVYHWLKKIVPKSFFSKIKNIHQW